MPLPQGRHLDLRGVPQGAGEAVQAGGGRLGALPLVDWRRQRGRRRLGRGGRRGVFVRRLPRRRGAVGRPPGERERQRETEGEVCRAAAGGGSRGLLSSLRSRESDPNDANSPNKLLPSVSPFKRPKTRDVAIKHKTQTPRRTPAPRATPSATSRTATAAAPPAT